MYKSCHTDYHMRAAEYSAHLTPPLIVLPRETLAFVPSPSAAGPAHKKTQAAQNPPNNYSPARRYRMQIKSVTLVRVYLYRRCRAEIRLKDGKGRPPTIVCQIRRRDTHCLRPNMTRGNGLGRSICGTTVRIRAQIKRMIDCHLRSFTAVARSSVSSGLYREIAVRMACIERDRTENRDRRTTNRR